jgi:hypothetical protein
LGALVRWMKLSSVPWARFIVAIVAGYCETIMVRNYDTFYARSCEWRAKWSIQM